MVLPHDNSSPFFGNINFGARHVNRGVEMSIFHSARVVRAEHACIVHTAGEHCEELFAKARSPKQHQLLWASSHGSSPRIIHWQRVVFTSPRCSCIWKGLDTAVGCPCIYSACGMRNHIALVRRCAGMHKLQIFQLVCQVELRVQRHGLRQYMPLLQVLLDILLKSIFDSIWQVRVPIRK